MTFKDLTPKKKIEHIWEYYRVHIGLTLLVVVILGAWFYNAKLKPHKDLFSGIGIMSYHLPSEYDDVLYEKVNSELNLTDTNSEVRVEYFYDDADEANFFASMTEKFMAMLLTGDVNIMVMDGDSMEAFAAEDYLLDLSQVYSEEELEEMDEEGLLLSTESELVPEEKYYAVCLKNSSVMSEMPGYEPENNYIAIYGAVENKENPKEVLNVILDEEAE